MSVRLMETENNLTFSPNFDTRQPQKVDCPVWTNPPRPVHCDTHLKSSSQPYNISTKPPLFLPLSP